MPKLTLAAKVDLILEEIGEVKKEQKRLVNTVERHNEELKLLIKFCSSLTIALTKETSPDPSTIPLPPLPSFD